MNEQLLQRIRNCPNLPTLPAIAVQVLDLAQRPDADIAEIARIISQDPALASKILRTVNSSFYGRSQNVSTVSHALVILGLQSVKTLVLGFSLVMNLTRGGSKGFQHLLYWKRSIFAATAARSLAAKVGLVQQEEAFLAALLMDIGTLMLDAALCEEYGQLHAEIRSHGELPAAEQARFGMTHAEIAATLAQQWKLPPVLIVPMQCHHAPERAPDPALQKLAQIVCAAGRCADVFVDEQAAPAIADVRRMLAQDHALSEADADALLADIGTQTREVASLFEINIGPANEYETILKKANETLVELMLQTQQQNQVLAEQATKDGLTGLANRAAFDQFLAKQFSDAMARGKPLALLMLDLDRFKRINDRHGHPAGDAVLRAVSKLVRSAARPQDLAARYGGEELVLVLPETTRVVAGAIAETIRRAIGARPIDFETTALPVTASIGVAVFEPDCPLRTASHLLKAADLAVYNAKHAGRNCVRICTLPKTADARPQAA